jgi:hypothetical protein
MEASRQELNDVMSISAQECSAVLQVFYVHLYFELFLGVLPQAKTLQMQKVMALVKEFKIFEQRNTRALKSFSKKITAYWQIWNTHNFQLNDY